MLSKKSFKNSGKAGACQLPYRTVFDEYPSRLPGLIAEQNGVFLQTGYPVKMRMDNGPELISLTLAHRAEEHGVILEFIKPGKPTQNAFIERFNRTYRTEILDFYLFRTLNEVREITEHWLREYNRERRHESLNNLTPEEYRLLAENNEISKSVWN